MRDIRSSGCTLIVSSSEKSSRSIASLMDPYLCRTVILEKTGSGARRRIQERAFDLIVINTPLSDEFGHELAQDAAEQTTAGVILIAKSDVYEELCDRVGGSGVMTICKPLSGQLFHQAVRMALSVSGRMGNKDREIARLKGKLEESLLVGRAKCLLISFRGMSEAEAHRYLEKEAMDTQSTRREIAEELIRLYEE